MAKPKAQTLQQRFGFMDEDLKKPKHDEMMLWLNDCVEGNLLEWFGLSKDWTDEEKDRVKRRASSERTIKIDMLKKDLERENQFPDYNPNSTFEKLTVDEEAARKEKFNRQKAERIANLEKQIEQASLPFNKSPIPAKPPLRVTNKQWERPIKSNDYIIGFIDMSVLFELPVLDVSTESTESGWNVKWEVMHSPYDDHANHWRVHFEVKTEIPSLGELIRQINMYRAYSSSKIFVVSPDDTHANLLREQDIGFIKFE